MDKRSLLGDLRARLDAEKRALDGILSRAKSTGMTTGQKALFDQHEREATALRERIDELDAQVRADDAAAPMALRYAPAARNNSGVSVSTGSAYVTREPAVYRRDSKEASWFLDAYAVSKNGDSAARERLQRNARQVDDIRRQEGRALSTTNGAGGE
ncbi:hypothetical protein ACFY0R_42810, partial [Streptomyces sp. NPDC001633]